jgi:hypothetical protein|tara:strand:- start:100 stop:456 length:357 start_codon:yes stop_codon:yes gene_type:complete
MLNLAYGAQLAQVRPANTNAATVYTSGRSVEITKIILCETSGSSCTFRIFHDNDGTTYDQTTALYYDVALAANTTLVISTEVLGAGLSVYKTGAIGFRTSVANTPTITIYGVMEQSRS